MSSKEPLKNYLKLITYGFTNPMPDATEGPWKVTAKDVINGRINFATARKTTQIAFEQELTPKSKPNIGDILLTKDGTLGRIAVVKEKNICVNQSVAILRVNDRVLPQYLYYLLSSPEYQQKLIADADGTTIKHIYITRVAKMEARIPSIQVQEEVVKALSCLDDKIELNNRINTTLEEMAQAIFKSWFVDFEPFQDGEFEDSELGRIPKGWSLKSLYDFAEYINGTSFKKDEYSTTGYPIVKITEIKNGITSATQYFNGSKDAKYYIKTKDILFSWSGNPQTSIDTFIWVGGDAILNQHTFKIAIKNDDYSFIYLLLKYFNPEFTRIASSKQTIGLGHVTVSDLRRMKFPYDEKTIMNFCQCINPVIESYINNLIENKKLTDIRDTLLPKLMTGEIRVSLEEVQ